MYGLFYINLDISFSFFFFFLSIINTFKQGCRNFTAIRVHSSYIVGIRRDWKRSLCKRDFQVYLAIFLDCLNFFTTEMICVLISNKKYKNPTPNRYISANDLKETINSSAIKWYSTTLIFGYHIIYCNRDLTVFGGIVYSFLYFSHLY